MRSHMRELHKGHQCNAELDKSLSRIMKRPRTEEKLVPLTIGSDLQNFFLRNSSTESGFFSVTTKDSWQRKGSADNKCKVVDNLFCKAFITGLIPWRFCDNEALREWFEQA